MRICLCLGLLAALVLAEDRATAELETATRDPDRGVRFAAVEALGKAGTGIDAAVVALDDPEWCVRQAAGRALSNIGESALPALKRIMKSGKPLARVEAVEAARRIGAKGAALVLAALDDEDAAVRGEALDGVALIGKVPWSAEQIARLRKLAESDDVDSKLNACLALHESDPDARAFLETQIEDLRAMVAGDARQRDWFDRLEAWLRAPEPPEPPLIDLEALASANDLDRADELAKIRRMGISFKQHEKAIAALLDSEDVGVARDAAIALECIGADAIGRVIDHGSPRAAYVCKDPTRAHLKMILTALKTEPTDDELADWMLLVGRIGHRDDDVEEALRDGAKSDHDRVRANSVWGLGQVGIEVPEALGDRSLAVREIAMPFVKSVPRLIGILNGTHREARILAARRLGQLKQFDALLAVSSHPDPLLRIAVAQALGERCPAVYSRDEARDVRIAAASVLRGPVLLTLLNDKNWRVRAAAVRSLGHARLGIDQLTVLLGSPNYAISIAAFESLREIGPSAALAVGRAVDNGNEAVWHYAPKLFESFGGAGAAGVGPLVAALKHPNPTARETAARCIGAVGEDVAGALPALVEALADRRLGVVAHAALALGRIGVTDAPVAGLSDKRVRVRAYSAFAIGWALGSKRGFDQAFFEPRLPVLDCGEPDGGVTLADVARLDALPEAERLNVCLRGLRSRDVAIAYPCVARLDFDQMDGWECERAVELVIAEGFRSGNPFDFSNFRSYQGCSELPATLQLMNFARDCEPDRDSIYGDFHRASRAENLPALRWFERHEDAIRLHGFGSLGQPDWRSDLHRAERSTGDVWRDIEEAGGLWNPYQWWLESDAAAVPESREGLLIDIAERTEIEGAERLPDGHRWSAIRLMGRADGRVTERFLRWTSDWEGPRSTMALASLARRSDPDATSRLVSGASTDALALGLLLEVRPALGVAVLRRLMADSDTAEGAADNVGAVSRYVRVEYGVRWEPTTFLGTEPAIPVTVLDRDALAQMALWVPGCNTRRLGTALLDRIEESGDPDAWHDRTPDPAPFLDAVDPDRFRSVLRRARDVKVLDMLARIRDSTDAAAVAQWIADGNEATDAMLNWPAPEIAKAVRGLEQADLDDLEVSQLGFMIVGDGWSLGDEKDYGAALRRGEGIAAARALLAARSDLRWDGACGERAPRLPWMEQELRRRYDVRAGGGYPAVLGELATWDADARAEYWSILRAGRYRWVVYRGDCFDGTLGFDFATLPHWAEDLDSNCCHVSGRVASIFEDLFLPYGDLYECPSSAGVGLPSSRRVREWSDLYGGELRWSPLARRFVPEPE